MKKSGEIFTIKTDDTLRELKRHGTPGFPFVRYTDDFGKLPGQRESWHWHRESEWVLTRTGSVDCLIGSERIPIGEGDGMFINGRVIHSFESESDAVMPNVLFPEEFIAPEGSDVFEETVRPVTASGLTCVIFRKSEPKAAEALEKLRRLLALSDALARGEDTLFDERVGAFPDDSAESPRGADSHGVKTGGADLYNGNFGEAADSSSPDFGGAAASSASNIGGIIDSSDTNFSGAAASSADNLCGIMASSDDADGFHGVKASGLLKFDIALAAAELWRALLRFLSHGGSAPFVRTESNGHDMVTRSRMRTMLGCISENYREKLTLEMIASAAGISKSEALRCFRRSIGTTPVKYLCDFRIAKAKELLRSTEDKVTTVALNVGIDNISYFVRRFSEETGMTPVEWRKRGRN